MSSAAEAIRVRLALGASDDLDAVMDIMAAAFDPRFGEGWTRSQCAGILPLSGVVLITMGLMLFTGELATLNIKAQEWLDDLGVNFFKSV